MRKIISFAGVWFGFFLMVAVSYDIGQTYCVIFPQNGRDIFGTAQRNILVFGESQVSLIPQVHFEGNARDFGILVPVPAVPTLSTVGANIFSEASFLTQPLVRQSSDGCGCDGDDQIVAFSTRNFADGSLASADESGGVTVIQETIVGTFQAAVLQATSAADLTQWLNENDYKFDPADSDLLQEYVDQDWFFVAMKLDPAQVPPFVNQWWTATTSPAKITFASDGSSLTYPLKISAISTNERMEVLVYTIGKDPYRFSDAKLEYANAVDEDEAGAIAENFPTLAQFAREGTFVTKLRRTFSKSEMQDDIEISPTDDRSEFREVRYVSNSGVGVLGFLILIVSVVLNRRNRKLN